MFRWPRVRRLVLTVNVELHDIVMITVVASVRRLYDLCETADERIAGWNWASLDYENVASRGNCSR
jgi:hypothetical protein